MLCAVAAELPAPAVAAEFLVNRTGDSIDLSPGDGQCVDVIDGGCSLRAAIIEANALPGSDRVVLPAGIVQLGLPGQGEDATMSGDLDINDGLELVGAGSELTIIDGGAIDSMLELHSDGGGMITIAALTLRNGRLDTSESNRGVGITVAPKINLTLADVVIRDQRSSSFIGALGIASAGCINGQRVRIVDNRDPNAPDGIGVLPLVGGIFTTGPNSCLNLVDSEISSNDGDIAGALWADDFAPVDLRRSLIADNRGRLQSAMLFKLGNSVLLENLTISGNRGSVAILIDGGTTLTLRNCTVTDNSGLTGTATVGGISDVHSGFGRTFVHNSIISGNGPGFHADDCERATSLGGNLIGDSARCQFDSQPSDQFNADPGFAPLADNGGATRTHLISGAAIDRGSDVDCPLTDQRGVSRPLDGDSDGIARCDVGAVEDDSGVLFANGYE